MWDEENRIRAIYDNGALYHYVYDASGERVLKGQGQGQRVFVNGEQKGGSGQVGNYTVYVNPYLVLKSGGYTKHYYIEGQRIVSKLGGGWDNDGKGPLKAGGDKIDYNGKTQKVFDGLVKNLKFLGADGQILTAGKSGKIPPGQLNGQGGGTSTSESFRYFYHPDHLGSTSYITDASGEVYQHLEYFAFGETFVEEHSNTDRTPYLFNGKEQDEETGLYYYGARYYDARTSIFPSVDPLAENYPQLTPYNYTANNPVNLIDPTGMAIEEGGVEVVRKRFDDKGNELKGFFNLFKKAARVETTVTVRNAKILDKSDGSNGDRRATGAEVKESGETMAREIEDTWTGSSTDKKGRIATTKVKFEGEIQVINHEKEAREPEFLMVITKDGETGGRTDANGGARRGSNKFTIDYTHSYLRDIKERNDERGKYPISFFPFGSNKENGGRVASHEFGHNGNLTDRGNGRGSGPGGLMDHQSGQPLFIDRWNFFRGR